MATDTKSSNLIKVKPGIGDGPSSSSSKPMIIESKKKVSDISTKQSTDAKHRSTNNVSKVKWNCLILELVALDYTVLNYCLLICPWWMHQVMIIAKCLYCKFLFFLLLNSMFLDQVKISKTLRQSKTVTKTVTRTRVKKVYSFPGQKFDVPEEREPLRIFYESLSKQIPSSEMAEIWMMEHGLLSPERAKKAFEKKGRKQKQLRTGTPIKSPPPPTISSKSGSFKKPQQVPKSVEVKPKRPLINESDDDHDDFVLSHKRRKG